MESSEVPHGLAELPETGRLYKNNQGVYCRIIELATNDEDGALCVVFRPFLAKHNVAMRLAKFAEPVLWGDGIYRQRYMPAAHLPDEGQRSTR